MVYTHRSEIDFSIEACRATPRPERVLLVTPDYFDVRYVINPHMANHVGTVDTEKAARQWERLRAAYEGLGVEVHVLAGVEGLPDMVFCANQTLPFVQMDTDWGRRGNTGDSSQTSGSGDGEHGRKGVVLSRMYAEERRGEVPHLEQFFSGLGYDVLRLPDEQADAFEGMGDAIWHPGRHLLWGGYGIRTDRRAYEVLSDRLDVRVITMELQDEDFYHLDTCFCALDETTVLIYPGAFDDRALDLIAHVFERVIVAPEEEARQRLACNAHSPDGRHVLIQEGCDVTVTRLRKAGYEPIEVDTSEFLKAGGSVFCMKQMFW